MNDVSENEPVISKVMKSLQQNNMAGYYVKDKEELLELLARLIMEGTTVGCGDSVCSYHGWKDF